MITKHFTKFFCIVAILLFISAVLSLLLSSFLSSSDLPDTAKLILTICNFTVPCGGILSMMIFISYRNKRLKSSK